MEDKRLAAEKAVEYVRDGMIVGLGTGSTAYYAIKAIGRLVESGMKLRCVATSKASEDLALECGIELVDLDRVDIIDVTIDGADEVDPEMRLIKGLGGALLREKIAANTTRTQIIIVDPSKIVDRLGTRSPLPVEVLQFGHRHTGMALETLGCRPVLRGNDDPFMTDGGNYIFDCHFDGIEDPKGLDMKINVIPGVVENGLFIGLTDIVIISDQGRIEVRQIND